MARTYTDTWSTSVTKTSSPYYITSGNKTTAAVSVGFLQLPPNTSDFTNWESGITRGTVGSTSASDPLAPQGNFAMQFTITTTGLNQYQGFSTYAKAAVAAGDSFPLIYKVNATTHRLMWNTPGFWKEHYGNSSTIAGDFNGRDVGEAGVWKIVVIRKNLNTTSGTSSQMMIAVLPSGTTYRTGWFTQTDDGHQVISLTNAYWNGTRAVLPVSSISYVDGLTLAQVDQIVTNAEIDLSPIPVANNGSGAYGEPVAVTLSAPADLDPSYTEIRYTLDGTAPTVSSTLYTGPINVGSPFTPGSTVLLKCSYFSGTLGKAQTKTYTYTFKVLEPIPAMFPNASPSFSFSRDVELTWTKAPPANTEYWYTMDNTDPQTSGTAIKWVPGAIYPFNSHPDATVVSWGKQQMLPNYLKVRAKHTTTNSWSAMNTTWSLYFKLAQSGYVTVTQTGGFNTDCVLSWGTYDDLGVVTATPITTFVSVNGTETTYSAKEGSLSIPFGDYTNFSIRAESNDGLLTTSTRSYTITFGQSAPTVNKSAVISSGATANIIVTNPNPSSTVFYTVDGSEPTTNSSSVAGGQVTIAVPNGAMLRAFASRSKYKSSLVTAEVFREFEVGAVATATHEGSNYHYYSATQRVEMNSPLGESLTTVTVGSNVSTTAVACTVDGALTQTYLWDVADQKGAVNSALTSLIVSDFKSRFWSRLLYTTASIAMSFQFDKTDWMTPGGSMNMEGSMTLLRISMTSKLSTLVFDYVVDCTTYETTIKRYRIPHGGVAGTETLVSSGTLASGTVPNNTITVSISSSSISVGDGTGTSTETLTGGEVGAAWAIDGTLNPDVVDIPAITLGGITDTTTTMPFTITTTATAGSLRRAPATVFVETASAFTSKSRSIKFSDKSSVTDLDFYVPCGPLKAHASVGFDGKNMAARVDGPFEWRLPYVMDGSGAFDVSVDFNTKIERSPGQDITLYIGQEGYSGSESGIDVGAAFATLRCVTDVDANGTDIVGSSALEMYAGSTATRIVAPTAQSRFKLRLVKTEGSQTTTAYGYVGDTEIQLGTVTAPTSAIEFKFVRKGKVARPAPMLTTIFGASASGMIRTKTITGAQLSGAWLMRKGVAVQIPATSISAPVDGVKAVFFDTDSSMVSVENLAFEPSDGRILVGVLDTRNDGASWTNLMFSKTVRVRSDLSGTLGTGAIIGAGDSVEVKGNRVTWLSSGYEQSLPLGTSTWVRPNVYVDLFKKKHIVRTFERQPIKLTLSAGPLL